MIDVLMLTADDLSNMALRFSECLKLLDIDVQVYKRRSHMNYGEEAKIVKMKLKKRIPLIYECPSLNKIARKSKVIHFISGTIVDTGINLKNKKVVVQYGGRPFVGFPSQRRKCTKYINNFVNYTIVHHPYLLNQGAKNECFIKPPVDTDFLKPDFRRKNPNKLIIGHFPSVSKRKGTFFILEILKRLKRKFGDKFDYIVDDRRVSWNDQIKRINDCDIIIECLTPKVDKDRFGEWSTATTETAALGKITITNSFNEKIYKKYYGKSEICIANNPIELEKVIYDLIHLSNDKIQDKKIKTREWVIKYHSMVPTSIMLWDKVYKHIFPKRKPNLIYGK